MDHGPAVSLRTEDSYSFVFLRGMLRQEETAYFFYDRGNAMTYSSTFLVLTVIILCFTYVNGFHDGCNAVATLIASRAMSPHKALALAAAVEFLTPLAVLAIGSGVADTMKTIVNEAAYTAPGVRQTALAFITGGILAAIVWNVSTWLLGLPASSSHALVGGVIGAGLAAFGAAQINWQSILVKVVLMIFLTPAVGFVAGFLMMKLIKLICRNAGPEAGRFFNIAQIFNMIFLAFNHSFNDSQKSVGIILLLMGVELGYEGPAPVWALLLSGLALALGISFGGFRIIRTVGTGIYRVRPQHSFASQLTAGAVILLSSLAGAPVSASQIVSSSIMGVGAAERMSAVKWGTVKKILFSWFFTLPAVCLLGMLFFQITKLFI
jgi:PiT family inorganic phosphate transporter